VRRNKKSAPVNGAGIWFCRLSPSFVFLGSREDSCIRLCHSDRRDYSDVCSFSHLQIARKRHTSPLLQRSKSNFALFEQS
jgi:hypothetical protein